MNNELKEIMKLEKVVDEKRLNWKLANEDAENSKEDFFNAMHELRDLKREQMLNGTFTTQIKHIMANLIEYDKNKEVEILTLDDEGNTIKNTISDYQEIDNKLILFIEEL